jgi:hypothetical protein
MSLQARFSIYTLEHNKLISVGILGFIPPAAKLARGKIMAHGKIMARGTSGAVLVHSKHPTLNLK